MDTRRLVDELVAARPPLDEPERRLAIALYRLLAERRSVSPSRLAEHAGVDPEEVERLLERRHGAQLDDGGAVEGFWGLALSATPHRLQVNGKTLHAWCAWDTLFLPALIGATVGVESSCASTDMPIALTVAPEGVTRVVPEGTVLSFVLSIDEAFEIGRRVNEATYGRVLDTAERRAGATLRADDPLAAAVSRGDPHRRHWSPRTPAGRAP